MRHEYRALREVVGKQYGDRVFNVAEGETVEVSAQGAHVLNSDHFKGDFEYVRAIPDTATEKERAKNQPEDMTLEGLMKLKREELEKLAGENDIENADQFQNKQILAEAILAKNDTGK